MDPTVIDPRPGSGLLPLVPQQLHGRERERGLLRDAFERVRRGATELVLVTGPAGIGKSALAEELGATVADAGGMFARGWSDPFHATPLSSFRLALGSALETLADGEAEERLALREALHSSMGDGVGEVAQLLPGLERVVGAVPYPPPVPSAEKQNRFRLMIGRFIGALATAERPLVLLLDDLHWAEPSSIDLLTSLVESHPFDHTLIVGGFRRETGNEQHALIRLAADPPASGIPVRRLELGTLDQGSSRCVVVVGLLGDGGVWAPLSDAVTQAAAGNPLAVLRFLGVLQDQGVLRRQGDGDWVWDMREVEQQALKRGSRTLLERVSDRLPVPTLRCLEAAACLAGEFSANELARGLGSSVTDTVITLQPAVTQHLLRLVGDTFPGDGSRDQPELGYRFAHEKIRRALYHRIPEATRAQTHLALGTRLMEGWQQRPSGPLLFDAADQLLRAVELGVELGTNREMADLFAAAGDKANRTAAWHRAVVYLEAARACLPDGEEERAWRLVTSLAEAYPMCGRVNDCEAMLDSAARDAKTLAEQLSVCGMRARTRVLDNRYGDSVQAGLDGLALLGHALPAIDDVEAWATPTEAEILAMAERMSDLAVEQLATQPEMTDERALAELALLGQILAPAYLFPHALSWAITRAVNLCLEHGNGPQAPLAYAMQGMLCCMGGDIPVGNALGRLAFDIVERRQDRAQEPQVTLMVVNFIEHHSQPLEDGFARGLAAIETALEQGQFQWAGWLAMNATINQLIRGEPLARLVDQSVDRYRMARDTARYDDAANFVANVLHVTAELAGRVDVTRLLADRAATPAQLIPALAHYPVAAVNSRVALLIASVISGDTRTARAQIGPIREGLGALLGLPEVTEFPFYESLVLADEHRDAEPERQAEIVEQIQANLAQLRPVAEQCPANQAHKIPLIEAELLAIGGSDPCDAYAAAAERCAARSYTHLEGLSWERRAAFLRAAGRAGEAREDLERAIAAYRHWGALAKVDALESS